MAEAKSMVMWEAYTPCRASQCSPRVQEMAGFCFNRSAENLQPDVGSCHSQYKHIENPAPQRLDRPSTQKMEELKTAPRGGVAMPGNEISFLKATLVLMGTCHVDALQDTASTQLLSGCNESIFSINSIGHHNSIPNSVFTHYFLTTECTAMGSAKEG